MRKGRSNRKEDGLVIVYEDESLIVVEKPSGLLSMSTGRDRKEITAYSMLYDYLNSDRDEQKVFIVHRLDRDTSGLLVFAKDEETKRSLQENWEDIVEERKYIAVVEGHIDDDEGWIESWLYEHPKSLKVHCFDLRPGDDKNRPPRKDWQFASTHCKTLKHLEINGTQYTMLEFELETGRKNQIRTHSAWIGHPIAGDKKYGAQTNPYGRLALHAKTLSFIHPWTGKTMKFNAPVPRELKKF